MEEDDFEVLPGSTYVKGFLRQYAVFLKLDADNLVEAYKSAFESRIEELASPIRAEVTNQRRGSTSIERRKKRVRRQHSGYALVALLAIIVVGLLAWFGASRDHGTASINAENISTSTISTVAGATENQGTSSTAPSSTGTSSVDSSTGGDGAATSTSTLPVATVSSSVVETTPGNGSAANDNGQLKMVVSVTNGSCWLVVREDGKNGAEVYAGTLSAGGRQTFDGAKRYWMNVGQPEALTVSIGGNSYTLAPPAGTFLVTEEGVERSQ